MLILEAEDSAHSLMKLEYFFCNFLSIKLVKFYHILAQKTA